MSGFAGVGLAGRRLVFRNPATILWPDDAHHAQD
jgi:hypothetical protein